VVAPQDDVDQLPQDVRLDQLAVGRVVGPQQDVELLQRAVRRLDLDLDVLLEQLL
jgi:hypothetical protein